MLFRCVSLLLIVFGFIAQSYSQIRTNGIFHATLYQIETEPDQQEQFLDSLYNMLGEARVNYSKKEYQTAIELYRNLISDCETSANVACHEALVHCYNGLAEVYLEQTLFEDALQYSTQALEYAELHGDELILAMTHLYRGNIFSEYFENNVDPVTNKPEDENFALLPARARAAYIKASNVIEEKNGVEQVHYVSALSKIGTTYIQEEKYRQAENYYKEALRLAKKIESQKYIIYSELNLAFIYSNTNRFQESINLGQELLNRLDSSALSMRSNVHYTLSSNYEQTGQMKESLEHYKKYSQLKDDHSNNKDQESLLRIKEQFENEKLQNENLELETSTLLATNKAQRAYLLSGIAGVAFLILLGVSLILSLRHRYQQQNLQLKMIRNEQDAEIRAINAMIDGREQERSEIGRFLHDQVASLLNSANLHLEVLAQKYEIEHPTFQKTQGILDDVADKVRTLSHQLLSDVLLKFGLTVALDDLCDRLSTPLLEFTFSTNIEKGKRYKKGIEDRMYSIAQELTNNIIKHSEAKEAFVILNETDDVLVMKVQDNGIGFTENDLENGGTGLKQIGLRIKSLGGNLSINTNGVTSVNITFPLHIAEKRRSIEHDATIQFENH